MLESALHILRHNPNLEQINIRWARENAPNHLKQEGTYDITPSDNSNPVVVMVHERGIPLVGRPFYRRYKYKVRPHGLATTLRTSSVIQMLRS